MKTALITGITGQDGAYLTRLLLDKGYRVVGACRRSARESWRLEELGIDERRVEDVAFELQELTNMMRVIERFKPDEVYNLAAQSFVAASFEQPLFTADSTAMGVLRLLEILRAVKPDTRYYQASTSEMFGKVGGARSSNETSPFYPRSPYAVSKLFAHWTTVNYREAFKLFACSGILFNHESELRGPEFVTRKITAAVARIARGADTRVVLGNMDARRDWGYAPDYVEAMWAMLQQDAPDDYVVATGKSHSVREFVEAAFRVVELEVDWKGQGVEERGYCRRTGKLLVEISPEYFRPAEVDYLEGDASKARSRLGWQPRVSFEEMVRRMVQADLKRVERKQLRQ